MLGSADCVRLLQGLVSVDKTHLSWAQPCSEMRSRPEGWGSQSGSCFRLDSTRPSELQPQRRFCLVQALFSAPGLWAPTSWVVSLPVLACPCHPLGRKDSEAFLQNTSL